MSFSIIGCVAMYLLIGAIINGIGRVDPEEAGYYGVLFIWPVVLILMLLIAISTIVSVITEAIKKGIHG